MSQSTAQVQKAYSSLRAELATLERQVAEKQKQAALLAQFLGKGVRTDGKQKPAKAAGKRKRRRKQGGPTIEQAILQIIGESKKPISTTAIIVKLGELGIGGARASVYGSISRMRKDAVITPMTHEGRGDAYVLGKGAPAGNAAPKPKKAGKKKKAGRKKKAAPAKPAAEQATA